MYKLANLMCKMYPLYFDKFNQFFASVCHLGILSCNWTDSRSMKLGLFFHWRFSGSFTSQFYRSVSTQWTVWNGSETMNDTFNWALCMWTTCTTAVNSSSRFAESEWVSVWCYRRWRSRVRILMLWGQPQGMKEHRLWYVHSWIVLYYSLVIGRIFVLFSWWFNKMIVEC